MVGWEHVEYYWMPVQHSTEPRSCQPKLFNDGLAWVGATMTPSGLGRCGEDLAVAGICARKPVLVNVTLWPRLLNASDRFQAVQFERPDSRHRFSTQSRHLQNNQDSAATGAEA
jgi:hypothetical protein